jgi:hypothetical protein
MRKLLVYPPQETLKLEKGGKNQVMIYQTPLTAIKVEISYTISGLGK